MTMKKKTDKPVVLANRAAEVTLPLLLLLLLQNLFLPTLAKPEQLTNEQVLEELGVKIQTKEWTYSVTAVEGTMVELPCNVSTSKPDDSVKLVLWFKNGSTIPIYTYDNRDGSHHHWSDEKVLQSRALFLSKHSPARLALDFVQGADDAVYKCRVDYRVAPTSVTSVTLKVIVPPETPAIFVRKQFGENKSQETLNGVDEEEEEEENYEEEEEESLEWKQNYSEVNSSNFDLHKQGSEVSTVGPFTLGDSVSLRCVSTRGRPAANVTWWRDDTVLMDDTFSSINVHGDDLVVNDLDLYNLDRHNLNTTLTCRASNNLMAPPATSSVRIDMHFGPSLVRLMYRRRSLSAGKSYQIQCEAIGARPKATITWWIDGKQIKNFVATTVIGGGNVTVSTLTYTPTPEDNGSHLACQAGVDNLPRSSVDDSKRLIVHYAPRSQLHLGRSLNASNIKEGDDVYFECPVLANPSATKIVWTKNGKVLHYSLEEGVIISNHSLVLQRVNKASSGSYTCTAFNKEGKGHSNPVGLAIKYKPYCRPGQQDVFGVATGETVRIPCEVVADPSVNVRFDWVFNTSSEWYKKEVENNVGIPSVKRGWTRSYIEHTPRSELDFGSLLCWAQNEIGRQDKPCLFHLLPAGKPDPVSNCSVSNQSYSTLRVTCKAGFNGGLKQTFVLEMRESGRPRRPHPVANLTKTTRPDFVVTGLHPNTGYVVYIYASNLKGRSDRMVLTAFTLKSDKLFETSESALTNMDGFQITPVLGILLTVGGAMSLVFLSISAYFCVRKTSNKTTSRPMRPSNSAGGASSTYAAGYSVGSSMRITTNPDEFQGNPDLVRMSNGSVPNGGKYGAKSNTLLVVECDGSIDGGQTTSGEAGMMASPTRQLLTSEDTSGGFEVRGEKTRFATLQRQRRQLYDELRDSKCRAQSLRRQHTNQFEGSSEKLLEELDAASPQHHIRDLEDRSLYNYGGPFSSSSGVPSPSTTPTPPPTSRRSMSPASNRGPTMWSSFEQNRTFSPVLMRSPMMMTRVDRDPQHGRPDKFITYSCPPEEAVIAEETTGDDESSSIADSSRESRV